ncbi:IS66-like element accessory protein TnpA [Roseinatronobacter sp.]|uniref:IS66-like element accessory protein TnpA n=1 Tax=Roseinatronobacter sp. TaxID=1945755 RepID=UPI0025FA839B|nr:transposase [Roseibaca sp.]
MTDHRSRPAVEILSVTDTGRRRRWTDAEKVRIVEESFGAPGRVAETARRHDLGRSLLVRWRRQYRDGELAVGSELHRFTPLTVSEQDVSGIPSERATPEADVAPVSAGLVEITLVNGRRLSVVASVDPELLLRLVQVLDPS